MDLTRYNFCELKSLQMQFKKIDVDFVDV